MSHRTSHQLSSLQIDHQDQQSESSFISRGDQSQSFDDSLEMNPENALFVIDPDTNGWRFNRGNRNGAGGVVQTLEEQELLPLLFFQKNSSV